MKINIVWFVVLLIVQLPSSGKYPTPNIATAQLPNLPNGPIEAIDWHPSGDYLAFGGGKGVWIYTSEAELVTFIPLDNFGTLAWKPDGTQLALLVPYNSDGSGWLLRVWDFAQRQDVLSLSNQIENSDTYHLAWRADGGQLAFGYRSQVSILDIVSGQVIQVLDNEIDVTGLAWNPQNSNQLVSSSLDSILVWDLSTGSVTQRLPGVHQFFSLEWSPSGKFLASVDDDPSRSVEVIQIWNPNTGTEVTRFEGEWAVILDLEWSSTNYLASLSGDGTSRIWNMADYQQVAILQFPPPVRAISWSPDGNYLAYTVDKDIMQIIDPFVDPLP